MTLATAKNKIARQRGYPNWDEMEVFIIDHNLPVGVALLLVKAMEEAAELYAASKKDENPVVFTDSKDEGNLMFRHWKDEEPQADDGHGGTIKHFRD